ncbi:MAG: alcohol dehydrogenase catalytic domain-containing protein [Chloroflexi bacterium]|nr:alcohol dehydrogenase catalytic domain-containing protein [Chloroflexota bacterium]
MRDTLPAQMRALVLPSPGKFQVETVPVPTPAAGEVLCKVRAVAICGSDPEILRGDLAGIWPPSYPFIPGHEWAGQVVAVALDVANLHVGDRVAGQAHKGCGVCRNCLEGRYTICENYGRPDSGQRHYGFTTQGAYAQYIAVSVKSVDKMPDTITFREGAMVDTAGVVEHGLALSGITPGGTVAVIGPGPIGLIAMRFARARGAARILAVGRGTRLQASLKAGADVLVDFQKADPVKAVRDATAGEGVDEVVECSGAAGTFRQAVEMVRKGGRVALLGVPPDSVIEPLPFKYIVHNEIAIYGSRANPNSSRKVIALIAAKQLVVSDLVTHAFPLEEFATALDCFVHRRENAIKVVVEPNGPEESGA